MTGLLDQSAAYRGLLAQLNAQQQAAPFFNPESLRLQLMASSLPANAPQSTRDALAQGTLPPIISPLSSAALAPLMPQGRPNVPMGLLNMPTGFLPPLGPYTGSGAVPSATFMGARG